MHLRPRPAVVAAAALLALVGAGCDTADVVDEAPPASESDDADAGSGGTDGLNGEAATGRVDPRVPPLLPEVDGLAETVVTIATAAGTDVHVDAKVAATSAERRRGLMQVPDLPEGVGMLFLFDAARTSGFWMRDTLVPLDIAYISEEGRIGTILAMDPCTTDDPADCPVYTPDQPYRAALEVPQGWLADQGVTTGDRVTWAEPVPAE